MPEQKYDIAITYKIYRLENGLLIEPKQCWGDTVFNTYDSQQEAAQAILEKNAFGDFVILSIAGACCVYEDL